MLGPFAWALSNEDGNVYEDVANNGLSYRVQSLHVGMQPPGHFSAVIFRNENVWKPKLSSFVENVNVRVQTCSFKNEATKFSYLYITPSDKTKTEHTSYTNKKTENGKLEIQQPSSLTFPS